MPDTTEREGSTAVATAEPPATPPSPPATGTAASGGGRKKRRWVPWVVGVLIAVVVLGGLGALVTWSLRRGGSSAPYSAAATPFDSAMKKAGVKAAFPATPVDLAQVKATGSHPFDATFTGPEVSALMNAFPHTVPVQGTEVAISSVSVSFPAAGTATLSGTVAVNSSTYSGTVTGPAEYSGGAITSSGATQASGEGIPLSAGQAQQVTQVLLGYLNGYLAAAPGLKIESASITADGVHVTGTAPDSLTMP